MSRSLLVTTGATITFEALIRLVLSKEVLTKLVECGQFDRLVIQYGNNPTSTPFYIEECKKSDMKLLDDQAVAEDSGKISIHGSYKGLAVQGINFDKDLSNNYTRHASLVISHGGSGSILDALRLQKKLIVLNNDTLSEGHQLDIINEFLREDQLIFCDNNYDPDTLVNCINLALTKSLKKIEPANGKIIQKVISQVI